MQNPRNEIKIDETKDKATNVQELGKNEKRLRIPSKLNKIVRQTHARHSTHIL
jgi:hypothetical protein